MHAVPLRALVTHCLGADQPPLLHLVGLSILGGGGAGARDALEDYVAFNFVHFEYFNRPFAVAASLHAEHQALLDAVLAPAYGRRHGERLSRLIQLSFLRDVAQPDLTCVACNALRPPNPWVCAQLQRLRRASPHEDVRAFAGSLHDDFCEVATTGKLGPRGEGESVANKAHMEQLLRELAAADGAAATDALAFRLN